MATERELDFYREKQAEDFDLVETAIEHAEKLGLRLDHLILDRDGRISETRFFRPYIEIPNDKNKEELPEESTKVVKLLKEAV